MLSDNNTSLDLDLNLVPTRLSLSVSGPNFPQTQKGKQTKKKARKNSSTQLQHQCVKECVTVICNKYTNEKSYY